MPLVRFWGAKGAICRDIVTCVFPGEEDWPQGVEYGNIAALARFEYDLRTQGKVPLWVGKQIPRFNPKKLDGFFPLHDNGSKLILRVEGDGVETVEESYRREFGDIKYEWHFKREEDDEELERFERRMREREERRESWLDEGNNRAWWEQQKRKYGGK